jgi:membrane-bound transcription factor site-1 protease
MLNLTVLNGMGVTGTFSVEPLWIPSPGSDVAKYIDIQFAHSEVLWPWSGYLALYITVRPEGANARGKVGLGPFQVTRRDRIQ